MVWDAPDTVLLSYPVELIDFDTTGIPEAVQKPLKEAIACHAHEAYAAAAIMVRRTLEALCGDKQAEGSTLKDRVAALKDKATLPPPLLLGIDNLRLLGNDAAHVDARIYKEVGKAEVELAIDVAKEVLKAVYQLDQLVDRLEKLKQPQ